MMTTVTFDCDNFSVCSRLQQTAKCRLLHRFSRLPRIAHAPQRAFGCSTRRVLHVLHLEKQKKHENCLPLLCFDFCLGGVSVKGGVGFIPGNQCVSSVSDPTTVSTNGSRWPSSDRLGGRLHSSKVFSSLSAMYSV